MNLVSPTVFDWIITAITGGVAGVWLVYDAINLWRARGLDRADAKVRDRHFGYVMGMVIGVLGVLGTLHYHGVW